MISLQIPLLKCIIQYLIISCFDFINTIGAVHAIIHLRGRADLSHSTSLRIVKFAFNNGVGKGLPCSFRKQEAEGRG